MQIAAPNLEEGKEATTNQSKHGQVRALPCRLLILFVLFSGAGVFFVSFYTTFSVQRFGIGDFVATAKWPGFPCTGTDTINTVDDQSQKPITTLDDLINPPSNPSHAMSDEELFWRATFTPRIKEYPYKRKPKIAFMFLTKGPLPLAPLWERFFKGNEGRYSVYIHSLPSYQEKFPSSSVFYKRNVPSKVAEWGRISMCDGERRLLANALLDLSNEWFVLVSESCIPLFNFTSIYDYISRSRYSFIGSIDEEGRDGRGRYNESMAPLVNITQWRKGAQWFEVHRKLAIEMVEDTTYYPKFRDFCTPRCYADEHYFQTMLHVIAPDRIANRSVTWVDWSRRGAAHPATFGKGDVKIEMFKRIRQDECLYNDRPASVCFLFARKFSPSALESLLLLSAEVFHLFIKKISVASLLLANLIFHQTK